MHVLIIYETEKLAIFLTDHLKQKCRLWRYNVVLHGL